MVKNLKSTQTNQHKQRIVIGDAIKEKYLESNLSIGEFADKICCKRENVYKLFKREQVDVHLLWSVSVALNFDFFKLYSDTLVLDQTNKEVPKVRMCLEISVPVTELDLAKVCKYCEVNRNLV